MRTLITVVFIMFFSALLVKGQNKIVGAPINVAVLLVDDETIEKMAETCRYYHLSEAEPEADFTVFNHPDGSKLRFKVGTTDDGPSPLVEVITAEKSKQIQKTLIDLGFKKANGGFERGRKSDSSIVECRILSKPTTLTFQKREK